MELNCARVCERVWVCGVRFSWRPEEKEEAPHVHLPAASITSTLKKSNLLKLEICGHF